MAAELQFPAAASSLLSTLGVQCCDASDVEYRVVDHCDAKVQLAATLSELAQVNAQLEVLQNRPDSDALEQALQTREKLQKEVEELELRISRSWTRQLKPGAVDLEMAEEHEQDKAIADAYAAVAKVGGSGGSAGSGSLKRTKSMPDRANHGRLIGGASGYVSVRQPKPRLDPDVEVVEESRPCLPCSELTASASGTAKIPQVDVNRLKPKSVQTQCVWKDNNPAEWRAMVRQGGIVSPQDNLLQARGVRPKRKKDSADTEGKKVCRRDDVDDKTFERRQARWNPEHMQSKSLVPKCEEKSQDWGKAARCKEESAVRFSGADVDIGNGLRSPRWLWQALYPYQQLCVQWLWGLHNEKMGGILADEMGLGKTIQIIAYLAALHYSGVLQNLKVQNTSLGSASLPSTGGILIVCPATLISQWRNEIHLWYPPLRVCVMHQVNAAERKEAIKQASSKQGILITSYETMRLTIEELLEATWAVVILDEGQKIRNPHASLTVASKRFSTAHRILVSGTPIQNNLRELWSLFDFVCPGRLGTLPVFTEEFAQPIEGGNLMGATEAKVAAAYQCAMALRELTEPCILRRTKAECMDTLRLPAKQEQVLFCHLTPEQYQLYVQFLETEQADANDTVVEDLWSFEKSGKMKVLAEILKLWHKDRHRVLIFVQTVQMLEILELWMSRVGYSHFRIDGKTPVKRRLKLIEEFNENQDPFAMLLTTRVGGVGLNIIGADRVVIFDPDWNPMTDVQARERAWRIGQEREVSVYRLVLTGTVEEKIYHRQVYKHFLAQKILQDPRQRRFFKWNDISDLFEVPGPPPNFTKSDMRVLQKKYQPVFRKLERDHMDEFEVETTEIMKDVADLPMKEQHTTGKRTTDENNSILQTLYDSQGIKASFNHDKVEQTLLDRGLVGKTAGLIAQRALDALKRSSRERSAHHISEPTWTGQRGKAGAVVKQVVKQEAKSKLTSSVSSADILQGLRQLASIRGMAQNSEGGKRMPEIPAVAQQSKCVGLPLELFDSDRHIAEDILKAFLDKKLAGPGRSLTTGQVLERLAANIAAHHNDLFKSLLKQMCVLTKPQKNTPGYWTLKEEFWPKQA
ncbi:unnamed protein product [Effrenium voratum]|nr:unnamed protein product [Effrenium voratum]